MAVDINELWTRSLGQTLLKACSCMLLHPTVCANLYGADGVVIKNGVISLSITSTLVQARGCEQTAAYALVQAHCCEHCCIRAGASTLQYISHIGVSSSPQAPCNPAVCKHERIMQGRDGTSDIH